MSTVRNTFAILASIIIMVGSALAQTTTDAKAQARPAAKSVVTASASAAGVRFVSPGESRRIRLEVFSATGERLFDSDFRAGNIIEWDATAAAEGSYLCIVTVEDLEGKSARKFTAVSKREGRVVLGREGDEQLKVELARALSASGLTQGADDLAPAARATSKGQASTVAAHDGQDGQVTSTAGALTFRTGNVFAGKEREQMRITPDGRVGIGTNNPEAALDVAGTIRARGGIQFEDGTVLTSAGLARTNGVAALLPSGGATPTANASGAGTANKLAKWADNAGALGDSLIAESGSNVGIGTAAPTSLLHVNNSAPGFGELLKLTSSDTSGANGAARFRMSQQNSSLVINAYSSGAPGVLANSAGFFADSAVGSGTNKLVIGHTGTNAGNDITFFTNNQFTNPQMVLTRAGNVGVGTTAPVEKFEVVGNVKLTGGTSGIIFPDGTKMTTAASGGSMSGTAVVSAINDPTTASVISDNRLSGNVARLGGANAWSGANVFGAGLSANNALITNVGNPVNAGDAVNKAYTDANFVKFVPGAEQLSVGDANGTAPMINLRGGSTCCSGPGGHTPAWFKVFQNGSFVATGNLGIGVSPMQGKGYRTSWDSYKGAFRSGYADNEWDDANVGFFSWAGGSNSTAIGLYALAFGDTNSAESTSSIVFGSGNQVKGAAGFSAGAGNRVCDTYGVAFGNKAQSGGPLINGKCDPDTFNIRGLAAVALGYNVTADQDHTTAMGKFATNNGFSGTFIWSDGSATASADTFRNTANNEFAARATGGFRFRTNLGGTTGCNLPAGSGVFNCTSSRTTKENFIMVGGEDVLSRLRRVPVSTWNYITEGRESRHMGPMAEDFFAAFNLGTSDKSIGVQDIAGVSLAAVKALDARTALLQEKTAEVEQLRAKVNDLEHRLAAIEQALVATKAAAKSGEDEERR